MNFTRLTSGDLFVAGHNNTPADIRAVLGDFLRGEGMDMWAADAATTTARFAPTWYSPTAGFSHDCTLHGVDEAVPGCADSAPVIVVMVA